MFCPNCGYMNYDDARYCHKCHMTLRSSSYAGGYNGDSYTGNTQQQYVSQQVEPNAQQQTYPAASPYTVYSANNASNGSPAPKSYKLPIILVSFLYSVSLWSSLYCGVSSLWVGFYGWLVKVFSLGTLCWCFGGWSWISSLWSAMKCPVMSYEMSMGLE